MKHQAPPPPAPRLAPPYQQAKERVRRSIMDGSYADRLPPERDLASTFGISYMTLRRAIGALVDEGLLRREVGRGTFVCSPGHLGRRTHTVGLVLPPHVRDGVENQFYAGVFAGALKACAAGGKSLVVAAGASELVPGEGAAASAVRRVDGLIGAAIDEASMPALVAAARFVPVVLLDSFAGEDIPCVLADNIQSSRAAIAALVALGHRRIGYVAGGLAGVGLERLEGYHLALKDAGIPLDDQLVIAGDFEFASGQDAGRRLLGLRPPPTAIACANDAMALGVLRAAQLAGVEIPDALSLFGFDDIPVASQVTPALSTVAVPRFELGASAVRLLLARMDNPAAVLPARTMLPAAVVLRASTAALRVQP